MEDKKLKEIASSIFGPSKPAKKLTDEEMKKNPFSVQSAEQIIKEENKKKKKMLADTADGAKP